jgi:hypothetical protein
LVYVDVVASGAGARFLPLGGNESSHACAAVDGMSVTLPALTAASLPLLISLNVLRTLIPCASANWRGRQAARAKLAPLSFREGIYLAALCAPL